jgi:molybdenum cofactor cytidylyltransferase
VTEASPGLRVAAIVLAAGGSSRMGQTKALLELDGRSLVRRAVDVARSVDCRPCVVVVGSDAERVRSELPSEAVQVVHNERWQEGLAGSIGRGIRALPEAVDAALLLLCDQPGVSSSLIEEMIETQRTSGKSIVASRYGDVVGAPVLFLRSRFSALLALEGDVGARAIVREAGPDLATVAFPDGAFDLDTPEDVARWKASGSS